MPFYSRIWTFGTSTSCGVGELSTLLNPSSTGSKTRGDILSQFPLAVDTCARAIGIVAEFLKRRLGASALTIQSSSNNEFTINLRVGRSSVSGASTITIKPTGTTCNYPVFVEYKKGVCSGSASFQDLAQMVEWLVESLQ